MGGQDDPAQLQGVPKVKNYITYIGLNYCIYFTVVEKRL